MDKQALDCFLNKCHMKETKGTLLLKALKFQSQSLKQNDFSFF